MTGKRSATRPGSIAHTIAECAREAVTAAQAPLTVAEHAHAYEVRHSALPATYSAQFFSLVRRGVLVAVDGRASRTRYAPHDSPYAAPEGGPTGAEGEASDDDALTVLTALRHALEDTGRDSVSTEDVSRSLDRLGLTLTSTDVNAVRVRLRTLSRTRRRGVESWTAPRVRCSETTTVSGRRLLRWSLADGLDISAVAPPTSRPETAADAVRELVRHVQVLLGRPVFRRELQWWLEANATDVVARHTFDFLADGGQTLSALLASTTRFDARRSGPGRLERVALEFTCHGGGAPRFWVGELTPEATRMALVEELANGLRLADELAAIEVLTRRTARVRIPAVARLIEVRRGALAVYLEDRLGQDVEATREAMEALLRSYARCRLWAAAGARTEDGRYARLLDLNERERHVRALPACAAHRTATFRARRMPRLIGVASAVALDALEPFLGAAEKELGIPRKLARVACLKGVRRIPLRPAGASRFGAHPERGDVGFDRADALLRMYRMAPATRTHALLDVAAELLGPVLRDASLVRGIAQAPNATPGLRRAAIVALALLGEAPAGADTTRYQSDDLLDGRAMLLARALSGAAGADLHVEHPALALAAMRLRNGRLLTALG